MARIKYDESSIKRLVGIDGIRARCTLYLGERGPNMVFQALKELWDNAFDEFLTGRNDAIFVYVDNEKNFYVVADQAEGIPVGMVPSDPENPRSKKVSTMTLIFTEIHTGGKFDDSAYKKSKGTFGVGAAATNAVSSSFEVWTRRDRKLHYQKFTKGKPSAAVSTVSAHPAALKKILPAAFIDRGSAVAISIDRDLVGVDGVVPKLDVRAAHEYLRLLALLNPGLTITLRLANGTEKVYCNKHGLDYLVRREAEKKGYELLGKPFAFAGENVKVSIAWSDAGDDNLLKSYVCSGETTDHGTHEQGFRKALMRGIKAHVSAREKVTEKDLYFGLIGMVDYHMSAPEFSSATKTKLVSPAAAKDVEATVGPALEEFFAKNKKLARIVIRRALDYKKSKEAFSKEVKALAEAKKGSKGLSLIGTLFSCPDASPDTREIYILEGDSALGSSKLARDQSFQEVFKLTGKIKNAEKDNLAEVMKSLVVVKMLTAIGFDFAAFAAGKKATDNIRCKNIILLSDADVDGPLRGDTRILTLDGRNPTIKTLVNELQSGKEAWVYSKDSRGNVVPAKATFGAEVKTVTKMVTVENCMSDYLHCDIDHLWAVQSPDKDDSRVVLRDGLKFIRAADLRKGDTLSSIKKGVTVMGVRVEDVAPTPVYCISVPEYGNFMVDDGNGDGICSANCHINILCLTLLNKFCPDLIAEGRVFIVDAPLFSAYYKGKRYYGATHKDCHSKMPKGAAKHLVVRSKGWGEIGHEAFAEVAFAPSTRRIVQITPAVGNELKQFHLLVGNESAARKQLLGV